MKIDRSSISPIGSLATETRSRAKTCRETSRLDHDLLERAKLVFKLRPEVETLSKALEEVMRREEQIEGLRALARLKSFYPERIED